MLKKTCVTAGLVAAVSGTLLLGVGGTANADCGGCHHHWGCGGEESHHNWNHNRNHNRNHNFNRIRIVIHNNNENEQAQKEKQECED